MTDWGEVYRANVDAVSALAGSLEPEDLTRRVPATPDWTVHDVLAHLAGSPADVLAGRMDDAPSDAWTARHVAERAACSAEELVAELQGSVGDLIATLEGNDSPAIVWNCAVHHADLHEALGKGAPPERMWRPVLEAIAPRMLGESAEAVDGRTRLRAVPRDLLATLADPDDRLGDHARPGDAGRPVHLRSARRRPARARARTLRPGVAGPEHRSEQRRELARELTRRVAYPVLRIPAAIPLMVSRSARSSAGSSSPRR